MDRKVRKRTLFSYSSSSSEDEEIETTDSPVTPTSGAVGVSRLDSALGSSPFTRKVSISSNGVVNPSPSKRLLAALPQPPNSPSLPSNKRNVRRTLSDLLNADADECLFEAASNLSQVMHLAEQKPVTSTCANAEVESLKPDSAEPGLSITTTASVGKPTLKDQLILCTTPSPFVSNDQMLGNTSILGRGNSDRDPLSHVAIPKRDLSTTCFNAGEQPILPESGVPITEASREPLSIVQKNESSLMMSKSCFSVRTPVIMEPLNGTTEFFGLGHFVRDAIFSVYGIDALHDWQNDMIKQQLSQDGLRKNGLVLAPTSCGKTIVAVVVLLHNLLVLKRDSIYALPYKALVAEKVREVKNVAAQVGSFLVQVYAGFQGIFPVPVRRAHLPRLYIGTNEKLSLLWKFLCKEGERRFEIGMIVFDEFHLIGDETRGGVLEEFASSVLHWSGDTTRIIGLSATVGNPETIEAYLGSGNPDNCQVYEVNARPTEIREHMVVMGCAFPIVRDAERRGTVIYSSAGTEQCSSSSRAPYDMMGVHGAFQDILALLHDDAAALWLKMNQLKIFFSWFSTCTVMQENISLCLKFPPVCVIPEYVKAALLKPATSETLFGMTSLSVVDPKFRGAVCEVIEAAHGPSANIGKVWTAKCNELQRLPDPYMNCTAEVRKADITAWNFGIVLNLVYESMTKKEAVLVFCNSRAKCVDLCHKVTTCLQRLARKNSPGPSELLMATEDIEEERANIIGHLQAESKGMVQPVLLQGIKHGVGFHSAELSEVERMAVEQAFSTGVLLVLFSTTTLSAGVNLPAMRVIISSPWIGKDFITCSKYMQMCGRAGRSHKSCHKTLEGKMEPLSTPDSYILIQGKDCSLPKAVGLFHSLLSRHVEPVMSQLLETPSFIRNPKSAGKVLSSNYTGVTRVVLCALDVGQGLSITQLIALYQKTLLYQCTEQGIRNIHPLLNEMLKLLQRGYIDVFHHDPHEKTKETIPVVMQVGDQSMNLADATVISEEGLVKQKPLSPEEKSEYVEELSRYDVKESLFLYKVKMYLSPLASAASIASLSLDDADTLLKELRMYQNKLDVGDCLLALYISLSPEISMSVTDDYSGEHSTSISMHIQSVIAFNYQGHPDYAVMQLVDITEAKVNIWTTSGSKGLPKDVSFESRLSRLWSAMFLRDLIKSPEDYEKACVKYGFCRGMSMELLTSVTNRLTGIKNFCLALDQFWWFPPLAGFLIRRLGDASNEELRPLMLIPHVTLEVAKKMVLMKIRNVQDVAELPFPHILSDKIKYLSKWKASEIVRDARILLSQEATQHSAEAQERLRALRQ